MPKRLTGKNCSWLANFRYTTDGVETKIASALFTMYKTFAISTLKILGGSNLNISKIPLSFKLKDR